MAVAMIRSIRREISTCCDGKIPHKSTRMLDGCRRAIISAGNRRAVSRSDMTASKQSTNPQCSGSSRPADAWARPHASGSIFDALEQIVIAIGFSVGEPPKILTPRLVGSLEQFPKKAFGFCRAIPLADMRLEALRAMAAAVREHPRNPDPHIITAFIAAGWGQNCVDELKEMAFVRWPQRIIADTRHSILYGVWHIVTRCLRITNRPVATVVTNSKRVASADGLASRTRNNFAAIPGPRDRRGQSTAAFEAA